jgi:PAS domain S-box-containing protein
MLEMELEQHKNNLENHLKEKSQELFESEKRYREIIETITDYVYQVKIESNNSLKTIHTEACFPITGYHSYEFINDPLLWFSIVFEAHREAVKIFFKNLNIVTEQHQKIEHRIVHKNGSVKWINNTIIIHRNFNGKLLSYDGVIKDITEKKRIENEIKQLNQHIIKLQEEERQRVARDLHDSVGQTILAAKINIEAYIQNPDRFKDRIDIGLSFLTQASNELREIYTGLYPTVLNDLGLEMAVRMLISNSIETTGIRAKVNIELNSPLTHDLNVSLYRIIQEIISNILKHSQATLMSLNLTSRNNLLKLIVKDNGTGFEPEIRQEGISGYGLANIKSRLENYNGTITIENNRTTGSIINIIINLQRPA